MARPHDDSVDTRILDATLNEIDARGLVGLRVAAIAEAADTTVAMIYRLHIDREGLIAATLSRYFDRRLRFGIRLAQELADRPTPITHEDIVRAVPPLRYDGSVLDHRRMQRVYIAAVEIPALRTAVREIAARRLPEFDRAVDAINARLPESQRFDRRILSIAMLRHNALFDDILGDAGTTNEEYWAFLRSLMEDSAATRGQRQ